MDSSDIEFNRCNHCSYCCLLLEQTLAALSKKLFKIFLLLFQERFRILASTLANSPSEFSFENFFSCCFDCSEEDKEQQTTLEEDMSRDFISKSIRIRISAWIRRSYSGSSDLRHIFSPLLSLQLLLSLSPGAFVFRYELIIWFLQVSFS